MDVMDIGKTHKSRKKKAKPSKSLISDREAAFARSGKPNAWGIGLRLPKCWKIEDAIQTAPTQIVVFATNNYTYAIFGVKISKGKIGKISEPIRFEYHTNDVYKSLIGFADGDYSERKKVLSWEYEEEPPPSLVDYGLPRQNYGDDT